MHSSCQWELTAVESSWTNVCFRTHVGQYSLLISGKSSATYMMPDSLVLSTFPMFFLLQLSDTSTLVISFFPTLKCGIVGFFYKKHLCRKLWYYIKFPKGSQGNPSIYGQQPQKYTSCFMNWGEFYSLYFKEGHGGEERVPAIHREKSEFSH